MKRKRCHQWPLAKVVRECRSAAAVWLSLEDMAHERGSVVVTPTREAIAVAASLKKHDTVSEALSALEAAGWIERRHVPVFKGGRQVAVVLRIALRRIHRKTGHTVRAAVYPEKRCSRRRRIPRKTGQDFSLRRRARVDAARPLPAGGCAPEEEDAGPVVKITDLLKRDAASGEGGAP